MQVLCKQKFYHISSTLLNKKYAIRIPNKTKSVWYISSIKQCNVKYPKFLWHIFLLAISWRKKKIAVEATSSLERVILSCVTSFLVKRGGLLQKEVKAPKYLFFLSLFSKVFRKSREKKNLIFSQRRNANAQCIIWSPARYEEN